MMKVSRMGRESKRNLSNEMVLKFIDASVESCSHADALRHMSIKHTEMGCRYGWVIRGLYSRCFTTLL